ncbi:MAG TPA: DUF6620 family protein [Polyangiaceae bacterium]|nr:DUF6620 family protein [Polyangiaceae bacterium]
MGFLDSLKNLFGGAAKAAQDAAQAVQQQGQPQPAQTAAAPRPQAAAAAAAPAEHQEEEPAHDDGEGRDYALEAKDDSAGFDLLGDLPGYYTGEFRIEQAWDDEAQRGQLFAEYKIRNVQHFYQVKATVERFIQSPQARAKYGDVGDIMHVKMKATQDYMMKGMQAQMAPGGKLAGEVEPVEGVSLEQWAEQQVRVASGGTVDEVCRALGCDKAKWDRVSAEWNARMSRDTTATIATAYGNAFTKAQAKPGVSGSKYAAAAQSPGKGALPIPLERYVEIMEAQNALTAQGQDAQAVLKKLGLSVMDWSNLGAWFSAYISENALRNDGAIHKEFTRLQEKYKAKYATAKSDADISF